MVENPASNPSTPESDRTRSQSSDPTVLVDPGTPDGWSDSDTDSDSSIMAGTTATGNTGNTGNTAPTGPQPPQKPKQWTIISRQC